MNHKIFIILLLTILFLSPTVYSFETQESNNFFTVEKTNGRWKFITPESEPFFSTGVCGIRAKGNYAPDLGYSPYYENIMDLYGSEQEWANVTYDRLNSWNFNTIACWSGQNIINKSMPYTAILNLAGANWLTGEIPDYFSEEWVNSVDDKCKEKCTNLSNESLLLGYFLDNELHWGPDWRSLLDIFDSYMQLPKDAPGKIRLVEFLRERYDGDIDSFNLAWRTNLVSFNQTLSWKVLGKWPYTVEARNDHNAFTYLVAEQYFKTCYEKIRKYDSNHLILGCRFPSFITPIEVVKACKPYVDVVSVNHYLSRPYILPFWLIAQDIIGFVRPLNYLQEYHDITDKPVIISEFYFRATDSGLPNTKPSRIVMPVLRTQWQRAFCFEYLAKGFAKKPYSIGYHWFSYADQPETGRNDGENSNIGLVNVYDEPYETLTAKMRGVNAYAQNLVD
jgi:agarase